jgi:rubrerythrin
MASAENLMAAFAGESQANRKYLAFAKKAEAENLPGIARLFRAAAAAETVHAHAHLRAAGGIKDTATNLKAAIEGESYEFQRMYPEMLEEAEAEGHKPAVATFRNANEAEKIHHGFYTRAAESLAGGKDIPLVKMMVCSVCGHTVEGEAPEVCPICGAKRERYFDVE